MPTPRLATLAALALATAACPNPDNPLGPPVGPPGGSAAVAFAVGGAGADLVRAVAVGPGGDIFVSGEFTGTVDFDPTTAVRALTSLGGTDVFLARFSATGTLQWAVRLGGPQEITVNALAADAGGTLLLGGGFRGTADFDPTEAVTAFTSNGGRDAWLASFTAAGTLRWARGFGGPFDDEVLGVALQDDGTAHAAGSFSGTMPVAPSQALAVTSAGGEDGFAAAWSAGGSAQWAFSVGGPGTDRAAAIAPAAGGGVYVGGSFEVTADFGPGTTTAALTSLGGTDVFLARYTAQGAISWVRGLHGAGNLTLGPGGVARASDGAILASGTFAGTADFDASASVAARTSVGGRDVFLVRYEATGGFGWAVAAGGSGDDDGVAVAAAPSGEATITGSFRGVARFDPGAAATSLIALGSAGATDAFVARYGASGGFRWAVGIGAPLADASAQTTGQGVASGSDGGVVVGGRFFGAADVNPGSALTVLTSLGGADGFVARYSAGGALVTRP